MVRSCRGHIEDALPDYYAELERHDIPNLVEGSWDRLCTILADSLINMARNIVYVKCLFRTDIVRACAYIQEHHCFIRGDDTVAVFKRLEIAADFIEQQVNEDKGNQDADVMKQQVQRLAVIYLRMLFAAQRLSSPRNLETQSIRAMPARATMALAFHPLQVGRSEERQWHLICSNRSGELWHQQAVAAGTRLGLTSVGRIPANPSATGECKLEAS